MSNKPKIFGVGTGFAGFRAAVAARRVAGFKADAGLVSPRPGLEVRPRLYEANPDAVGWTFCLYSTDRRLPCAGKAVELDIDARPCCTHARDG